MSEAKRVTMKQPARFVDPSDVSVSPGLGPDYTVGRRFNFDIDEAVLAQIGSRAVEAMTDQMVREIAYRYRGDLESVVVTLLADLEWVKPILESELRAAARDLVKSLWSNEEKAALRSWFDVLTAAAKGRRDGE